MGNNHQTYIIAEAGVNHNSSVELAKELIDVAAEAGANAVKFQTFKTEKLVSKNVPKATYQKQSTDANESQFAMIKKLELDEQSHYELIDYCNKKEIQFLSTPFDFDSVDLLANQLDLPKLKVSSGDINNAPLLLKMARTGKQIILSTGMSNLAEIERALAVIAFGYVNLNENPSLESFYKTYISNEGQKQMKNKVTLLHCTSEYPAPFEDVNLNSMLTLKNSFGLPVGLSDHTLGITVPIAAVALGATVIEKHFTIDKKLPGPDHQASLEPNELKEMVKSIRQVELALGSSIKSPTPSEIKNKLLVRKSLVAARTIKKGEKFTVDNLTIKRPGLGIEPIYYWDFLKKKAERDYQEDELVMP